jgi:hypothetical protein
MSRRVAVLCLFAVLPLGTARAAEDLKPEQLLAADSVFYFRYDGIDAHRKAFEQSAAGDLFRGEAGDFLDYLIDLTRDGIGPTVLKERVLEGGDAKRLQPIRAGFRRAPEAIRSLVRNGFVVGVEVVGLIPPRVQLTVVFPNAADVKHRADVIAGLRLIAALSDVHIDEGKVGDRTMFRRGRTPPRPGAAPPPPPFEEEKEMQLAWWVEGPHVVLTLGTEKPERTLELLDKKRKNLTESPLFKELEGFKDYETVVRGFVDLEKYVKMMNLLPPPADQILGKLGIENLKSIRLHIGFEGRNMRTTLSVRVPGKRSGLIGMIADGEALDPTTLPPLPPDMTNLYALNVAPAELFDLILTMLEAAAAVGGEDGRKPLDQDLKDFSERIGVDIRKDIVGMLGGRVILYNAPSEGPMSLGFGAVFDVKDEATLKAGLANLLKAAPMILGDNVTVRKQACAGADLYSFHSGTENFIFSPSFSVHKGRLVAGLYPQTVRGYLQRANGKMTAWKPATLLSEAFATAKKGKGKVVGLMVSDPRPTIRQLCSIGPLIGGLADGRSPGSFDVARIPNGQAATEPLFPNVGLLMDDGESLRLETRDSLALPFIDLSGMDSYFSALIGYQILRLGTK